MKHLIRNIFHAAGFEIHRVPPVLDNKKRKFHFLHIGKNAGSQIGKISRELNSVSVDKKIIVHGHDTRLKDLPLNEDYFFSIRNPIKRFVSGFYSRKRKGQPYHNSEWSEFDKIAFSEFEHANDLAESLFAQGRIGMSAWAAMKSIRHTSQHQADWFCCAGNFLKVRPPVWIIRQENFDSDINTFMERAGFLPSDRLMATNSTDSTFAHRNDYSEIPQLSELAIRNLKLWYAPDFVFYDICEHWIRTNEIGTAGKAHNVYGQKEF
ncbi:MULTISPECIES: sulfotransferase family 2 domain-containing protein [Pseudomonadota]|jgi:hypothetical protein|uniref:sulfotransferase family 2 domain-containing protein n=1 Tax=Pseudomonadota TaxID=1224 RepID=UPI003A8E3653